MRPSSIALQALETDPGNHGWQDAGPAEVTGQASPSAITIIISPEVMVWAAELSVKGGQARKTSSQALTESAASRRAVEE
jgi:hypothetical protein